MTSFEEIKPRFWDRSSEYLVEAPLTEAALAEAERTLGVTLPPAYVELLRERNGGVVAREFRRVPTEDMSYMFDDMRGIGRELLSNAYYTTEWEMPPELVLLTGDGHWWIALDYRAGRQEPAVTYYDNELGKDIRLAGSFLGFVEGLEPEPEIELDYEALPAPDYAKSGGSAIAFMIATLRSDLGVYQQGRRSLAATRAWLAARPSEVIWRLPRRRTRRLRAAVAELATVAPERLPEAVDAVIAELEVLIPRWLNRRDTAGGWHDERYLRDLR